jgi:hypothetical protein
MRRASLQRPKQSGKPHTASTYYPGAPDPLHLGFVVTLPGQTMAQPGADSRRLPALSLTAMLEGAQVCGQAAFGCVLVKAGAPDQSAPVSTPWGDPDSSTGAVPSAAGTASRTRHAS